MLCMVFRLLLSQAALNTSTYFEFTYLLNWHRISSILAVAAVVVCSCVLVSFLSFFKVSVGNPLGV